MFNAIYFSMYKKSFSPLPIDKSANVNAKVSKYKIISLLKLNFIPIE